MVFAVGIEKILRPELSTVSRCILSYTNRIATGKV